MDEKGKIMDLYKLVITVPSEPQTDEKLDAYLRNKTYTHVFYDGLPPKRRRIVFENLNEQTIAIVKSWFREAYKDSKYVNVCNFQVLGNNEIAP